MSRDNFENESEDRDKICKVGDPKFNIDDSRHFDSDDGQCSLHNEESFNSLDKSKSMAYERQFLDKSGDLAEMVCIILGDGGITKGRNYNLTITLNRIDEAQYVEYVAKFMENLFGKAPSLYPTGEKGIRLTIHGKELVGELESHGLISGNKVENQVSIPSWIKKSENFVKRGLRGLTDTDGSIKIDRTFLNLIISFSNSSRPLVEDFRQMCCELNIDTSRIYDRLEDSTKDRYDTRITKRDHVKKFVDIVRPLKWKYRRYYLGINLIAFSSSFRGVIKSEVNDYCMKLGIENVVYTKDFESFLTRLCVKYNLDIKEEALNNATSRAFEFRHFPYREDYANLFKKLYEKLGNLSATRRYLNLYHNISPKKETIKSHIQKLMSENNEDFDLWYENIKRIRHIVITNDNNDWKVSVFPPDLRKIVLSKILLILRQQGEKIINSDIINILLEEENPRLLRLQFPLIDINFKRTIYQYLNLLIEIIRMIIIHGIDSDEKISEPVIKNYFNNNLLVSIGQLKIIIHEVLRLDLFSP